MADEAPKMTMTRLAEQVGEGMAALRADINQAAESAEVANKVNEELAKKVTTLQQEQKALAMLVNGIKGAPGDAVRPSKIDNVLARLEAVERNGTQDWSPLFEAHKERVDELAKLVKSLDDRVGGVEDKSGTQPGGPFEDIARDIEALKTAMGGRDENTVANLVKDFDQLQAAVARLEHDGPQDAAINLAALSKECRTIVRDEIRTVTANLSDRLAQLEEITAVMPVLPGRAPAGHATPAVGNVHAKLLELMREVDHIAKSRTAKGGGMNYKFRGIDDAQNAVGQAMRKIGLLLQPEVIDWQYVQTPVEGFDDKGRTKTTVWSTSRLTMNYTFVSPDDGSTFTFSMIGEGRDAGDKSGSKAASMACKYALFQALMVPLEVDESDGHNPVMEHQQSDTPGARVSRGEITPAQAVEEYTRPKPQVSPPTGYNPAMDSSAMAGADTDDTLMQKAAQAAHYLKQAQQQPAEVALSAIAKLKKRVEEYEIGGMTVRWSDGEAALPLRTMIDTALQNVNATIAARAKAAGAQGVTRQGQQSGEGARAAAYDRFQQELTAEQEPPAGYEGSKREYEDALKALAQGAPDAVIDNAMRVVADYERMSEESGRFGGSTVAYENPLNPGGTATGDHDY